MAGFTGGKAMMFSKAVNNSRIEMMPLEPLPAPVGSEVILQVDVAGLCHSDLHQLEGLEDRPKRYGTPFQPFAGCHEIGGTVLQKGPNATNVEVGKQYVLYPWLGCGGLCKNCKLRGMPEIFCAGREQTPVAWPQVYGSGSPAANANGVPQPYLRHGGYASHLMVPDSKYLVDAGNCPLPLAATYTCSGLTTYSAVRKCMVAMQGRPQLTPDQSILIIGAGGLGSHAISWAKLLTEAKIVVADVDKAKHANAIEMGADVVVDTSGDPQEAVKKLQEATDGGPFAVIDIVGRPETCMMGRAALRKGGTQVQVGLFGGEIHLPVNAFATEHKHLLGNFVGTFEEFLDLMEFVRRGKKKDIPYETRPIEQLNEAMADLTAGKIVGRCVMLHNHAKPKM